MNDLSTLLGALAGLISATTGAVALLVTIRRLSPRERRNAAEGATRQILTAAEDGAITPDELDGIRQALEGDAS